MQKWSPQLSFKVLQYSKKNSNMQALMYLAVSTRSDMSLSLKRQGR